jgi:AraC family transcriptional regulator
MQNEAFCERSRESIQPVESISLETLAELAELSPFHFSRVFKQSTGMPPLKFVIRERMLRAQQLIRETSGRLIEIAFEVGQSNAILRRYFGVKPASPTDYRRLP